MRLARASHEDGGYLPQVLDAAVEVGKDLFDGEGEDSRYEFAIEGADGVARKEQQAVALIEGNPSELRLNGGDTNWPGVLTLCGVLADFAVVEVESDGWSRLRNDGLLTAATER